MNRTAWIDEYNKNNNGEYLGYVFYGEYLAMHIPGHRLASKDGYVYIHRLQAEKKLGRHLDEGECVHHIDENKYNNAVENLIIFKTVSDHTAFHNGVDVQCVDGVWIANIKTIRKNGGRYDLCPCCKTSYKDVQASHCIDCHRKYYIKKTIRPSRDELFNLLLSYNMCEIGRMYCVSDNCIRKWCKSYDLPYKRDDINKLRNNSCKKVA